jgi:hypothetical protein
LDDIEGLVCIHSLDNRVDDVRNRRDFGSVLIDIFCFDMPVFLHPLLLCPPQLAIVFQMHDQIHQALLIFLLAALKAAQSSQLPKTDLKK